MHLKLDIVFHILVSITSLNIKVKVLCIMHIIHIYVYVCNTNLDACPYINYNTYGHWRYYAIKVWKLLLTNLIFNANDFN